MPGDDGRDDQLADLAPQTQAATRATALIHYARSDGRDLRRDCRAAYRLGLLPGPGQFLRTLAQAARRFDRCPGAVLRSVLLAQVCRIDVDAYIRSRPPRFTAPDGHDEDSYLRELTFDGIARRLGTRTVRPDAHA